MSQRTISNAVPESDALSSRRQSHAAAGHSSESLSTVAMFHSAHNLQLANSTFNVAGADVVHNYNVHYHSERPRDIWGILQSIPNFRKIYQDMMSKATAGTGMWLVKGDKFRVWLEPNGDIKIFWGSGIPGAGKTLLASIVIEYLEALYPGPDAKICICYVYFRYSDHSEMTVRTILETFVMQTLERHPGCMSLVEQTYARHLRERTEPSEAQLLALLRQLADCMFCTFYILDALDEAPTKIQLAILKTLDSLSVKLFITSIPLKPLEAHFPHAHTFPVIARDIDIDLHITKVINENAELQRLLQANPSLRHEIFSTIRQNCGGVFLHASLQLDTLHECVSANQVRQRLQGFPSRIEDVYLRTWDRILGQNTELAELAKTVLVWVLNAPRSMTVEELERAVATSPDTYKFEADRFVPGSTLIYLCRGLISLEEESRIVRLVHYTAKDTLENLLHESFPHPHSPIAAVCMSHPAECGSQDTRISSDQSGAALNKDPLLGDASDALAHHAGKSFKVDATKCNPNVMTALHRQSPLIVASQSGHEGVGAHIMALSSIEVNMVDARGRSALILAAEQGNEGNINIGKKVDRRPYKLRRPLQIVDAL